MLINEILVSHDEPFRGCQGLPIGFSVEASGEWESSEDIERLLRVSAEDLGLSQNVTPETSTFLTLQARFVLLEDKTTAGVITGFSAAVQLVVSESGFFTRKSPHQIRAIIWDALTVITGPVGQGQSNAKQTLRDQVDQFKDAYRQQAGKPTSSEIFAKFAATQPAQSQAQK